ncbi:MAG TPA: peptide chain release factor N(5)-glutamine methyltransferase, partial [Balneola sp.]|nr:peptide chain release factor N(5)-glutamine methyltransferase [Balneola sp.]
LFCSKNLKKNGVVYLEFHENNSDEVAEVFSSRNWTVQIVKDFDEKDRFLVASKE